MEERARPLAYIRQAFLKRSERRDLKKGKINIASLTLRDCLGLSFKGIYIYLVIIIIIIIIIIIVVFFLSFFIQFSLT